MRIQTDGNYEWRAGLYNRLGEGTRSGGIDGFYEFMQEMLDNLKEAVEHPDMTGKTLECVSTSCVKVEFRVETGVNID